MYVDVIEDISSSNLTFFIDTNLSESIIGELVNGKNLIYQKTINQKKEYIDNLNIFNNDDIDHVINIFIGDNVFSSFSIPSKKTLSFYKSIGFNLNSVDSSGGGGSSITNTDNLPEGTDINRKYFSTTRVLDTELTPYIGVGSFFSFTDKIVEAFAKLQSYLSDLDLSIFIDSNVLKRKSDSSPFVADFDVKGGSVDLSERLGVISRIITPLANIAGQHGDNSFTPANSTTLAGAANRFEIAPYIPESTFSVSEIGCAVSSAIASALVKVVIYSATTRGEPDTLIYEGIDLDASTTGYKFESVTFTFEVGKMYFVGIRHNSTATLRSIPPANCFNLGLIGGGYGSTYGTVLRRVLTYTTPAPLNYNLVNTDRVAAIAAPSVRWKFE